MNRYRALTMSVCVGLLAACTPTDTMHQDGRALNLEPLRNDLVDNLYIASNTSGPSGSMAAGLGGTSGAFRIEGRCLIFHTTTKQYTPIFPTPPLEMTEDGFKIGPDEVLYEEDVVLWNTIDDLTVSMPRQKNCPITSISFGRIGLEVSPTPAPPVPDVR